VILIVVDTLRADHLGVYGHERPTSPELDELAQRGAVFENAFTTSPWTLPSFGSIFTGRLPAEHRAGWPAGESATESPAEGPAQEPTEGSGEDGHQGRSFLPLRAGAETLAETLAASGRHTAAVMNNSFLHPDFGVARGFQTYDHIGGNRNRIRRADKVVDRALEWLGEEDRGDFLLVVHLFDPHLNYDAPEDFQGRFSGDLPELSEGSRTMDLRPVRQRARQGKEVDWDFLRAAYDEEIAFTDQQIGRFWRALEESGQLEHTLVVFTSDHGEEFFDHGGFEHGHSLFNELVRAPLILWGPGIQPGRFNQPASLIDLYPTVLDALGLPVQDGLPGRSLWPLVTGSSTDSSDLERRTLISERPLYGPSRESAIAWPYKLVREPGRDLTYLFNLEDDPAESQNIARLRTDIALRLGQQLLAYHQHAEAVAADDAVELDEKTLENLRSLGYIQ
jgi:arylsulfatase A-like enzyme